MFDSSYLVTINDIEYMCRPGVSNLLDELKLFYGSLDVKFNVRFTTKLIDFVMYFCSSTIDETYNKITFNTYEIQRLKRIFKCFQMIETSENTFEIIEEIQYPYNHIELYLIKYNSNKIKWARYICRENNRVHIHDMFRDMEELWSSRH